MDYRTLLLDADGTLLDFGRDMQRAFSALYAALFAAQRPYRPEYLRCYNDCNERWWRKLESGACTKPELYVNRFRDFLAETGFSGDPVTVNEIYFRELGKGGATLPGALELTERLSKKYELYIVTNGNAVTQKTRLENSGLMNYVKEFFVSEDAGAAKPDPRYFDYVFTRLPHVRREQCLVIGDSLTSDIRGAQNAGLDSLYYHPDGPAACLGKSPWTYEAGSYEEMAELLGV